MTSDYNAKTKRRVIPRWRSSHLIALSHEFQPLRQRKLLQPSPSRDLANRLREFKESPSLGVAADLLAIAAMSGHPEEARDAGRYILDREETAPRLLLELAASVVLGRSPTVPSDQQINDARAIARIRELLKFDPRSPALWADMARHFASLGEDEKSLRCMRTALGLAPNHRWLLRSANRLLLHLERPDEAHRILVRNARTSNDPWLLSAEIATSQILNRTPKFMRQANDIIRHKTHAAMHVSELAAAIATSYLDEGNRKGARRLLRVALKDPTENALAQIEWAERDSATSLEVEHVVNRVNDAYEADCWLKYNTGRITEALQSARKWLRDEPFADRPAAMICHIAGLLDDYKLILEITDHQLNRDPANRLHVNNRIFARISSAPHICDSDDPSLAKEVQYLQRMISAHEQDFVHSLANLGLLRYRTGEIDKGKHAYDTALSAIEKSGVAGAHLIAANACIYHAREAILARAPWAPVVLGVAAKWVKHTGGVAAYEFYLRKLDALARDPSKAGEILTPSSAPRFLAASAEGKADGGLHLEYREGRPVLWLPNRLRRKL